MWTALNIIALLLLAGGILWTAYRCPTTYDGYETCRVRIGILTLLAFIGIPAGMGMGVERTTMAVLGFGVGLCGIIALFRMNNRQNTLQAQIDEDEDWQTALSIVRDPISGMNVDDTAQIVAVFKAIQHGRGHDVGTLKIAQIIKRRAFRGEVV